MSNPYSTPEGKDAHRSASSWADLLYQSYTPMWYIGTVIIILSWIDVVNTRVGWAGFILACLAWGASSLHSRLLSDDQSSPAMLDSRALETHDAAYHDALEQFRLGTTLLFDGVYFELDTATSVSATVVSSTAGQVCDEVWAQELASHAEKVLGDLKSQSAEFADIVNRRELRVSLLSANQDEYVEVCQVVAGHVRWTQQ